MKRFLIYLISLLPLLYLLVRLFIFEDVSDPIKYIYTITGASATVIIFFSITLSLIREKINLIKYRKEIGLLGFFYALLHLLNFIVLDASFDFSFIIKETVDKPFIYLGMIAFFIVLFMAITSTKDLFRKYNKYHKFVYLALILVTIHWIMAQKAISILQFIYIGIILIIGYYKLLQQIIRKYK
ncbi:periplasmic DMSO/TMAO reductase YedYZ, heme-binding membrane subunit [Arcobacter venerupis]|uniref:Periplasmic DMSO/TMAO reductase YedYZ, heme-binding membrane subunit n=1 Tax=Arcobacter venerupis TaxID=1054033 RepID=A0AAE7E328_9BACT|nr:ferric reductase-like transmembrane domain-containing protein [Arcobacter venerupis]QKF66355.1 periplasmic DMSO/TMAO reductase YedYZ, heme-binding membrane subunit [Arcobacter venerupis]RWS50867.1 ferric reductase [Arcobacter venerupis]